MINTTPWVIASSKTSGIPASSKRKKNPNKLESKQLQAKENIPFDVLCLSRSYQNSQDFWNNLSSACRDWVQQLAPILSSYDYNLEDMVDLLDQCCYDPIKIQLEVDSICEQKSGHEHSPWKILNSRRQQKKPVKNKKKNFPKRENAKKQQAVLKKREVISFLKTSAPDLKNFVITEPNKSNSINKKELEKQIPEHDARRTCSTDTSISKLSLPLLTPKNSELKNEDEQNLNKKLDDFQKEETGIFSNDKASFGSVIQVTKVKPIVVQETPSTAEQQESNYPVASSNEKTLLTNSKNDSEASSIWGSHCVASTSNNAIAVVETAKFSNFSSVDVILPPEAYKQENDVVLPSALARKPTAPYHTTHLTFGSLKASKPFHTPIEFGVNNNQQRCVETVPSSVVTSSICGYPGSTPPPGLLIGTQPAHKTTAELSASTVQEAACSFLHSKQQHDTFKQLPLPSQKSTFLTNVAMEEENVSENEENGMATSSYSNNLTGSRYEDNAPKQLNSKPSPLELTYQYSRLNEYQTVTTTPYNLRRSMNQQRLSVSQDELCEGHASLTGRPKTDFIDPYIRRRAEESFPIVSETATGVRTNPGRQQQPFSAVNANGRPEYAAFQHQHSNQPQHHHNQGPHQQQQRFYSKGNNSQYDNLQTLYGGESAKQQVGMNRDILNSACHNFTATGAPIYHQRIDSNSLPPPPPPPSTVYNGNRAGFDIVCGNPVNGLEANYVQHELNVQQLNNQKIASSIPLAYAAEVSQKSSDSCYYGSKSNSVQSGVLDHSSPPSSTIYQTSGYNNVTYGQRTNDQLNTGRHQHRSNVVLQPQRHDSVRHEFINYPATYNNVYGETGNTRLSQQQPNSIHQRRQQHGAQNRPITSHLPPENRNLIFVESSNNTNSAPFQCTDYSIINSHHRQHYSRHQPAASEQANSLHKNATTSASAAAAAGGYNLLFPQNTYRHIPATASNTAIYRGTPHHHHQVISNLYGSSGYATANTNSLAAVGQRQF